MAFVRVKKIKGFSSCRAGVDDHGMHVFSGGQLSQPGISVGPHDGACFYGNASAFPLSAGLYSVRVPLRLHSGLPEGVEGNRVFCSWRNEPGFRIRQCLLSGGVAGGVFVPFYRFPEIQESPPPD